VRSPLHHPDPAHCLVSGTGLTHLGSAAARDAMHQKLRQQAEQGTLTDSMRMFQWGVEGGNPAAGEAGAQPEWFYKGDGAIVAHPGATLDSPDFALDGGEEPELVGLYLIGPDGTPHRLGFAIGNEFSDHVTERSNYLYLAHSKLRACAIGPELRTGALPRDLRGTSRIHRDGAVIWQKPFLTGEANMCHSLDNLEYHHFKYAAHRRRGDVHLHFFGTATLSFADGVRAQPGDLFEIDLQRSGQLRNSCAPAGFARWRAHAEHAITRHTIEQGVQMARIPAWVAVRRAHWRGYRCAGATATRSPWACQVGAESEWRTANTRSVKEAG
jgi:hypothetical protein